MIKVKEISFVYEDGTLVFDKLNLNIATGEKVGIIGPNGAGKTTLFYLLCGLLKPKSGEIFANSKNILPGTFNPDIGFIFQNPDDQLFNVTVFEDVAFGLKNIGINSKELTKKVEKILNIAGISHLKDKPSHHLSGGERRMAAIASVISMSPQIIIYDEPTSNLDMRARRKVINFINSSRETTIVSSHDLEFVLETCQRIILIDNGKIITSGNPDVIMGDEKLMLEHGLERPHSLLHKFEHSHKK